jgi:hypothetical protein
MKSPTVQPSQLLPKNILAFILLSRPLHAELSGEQPFFDMDLLMPFASQRLIHPGQ